MRSAKYYKLQKIVSDKEDVLKATTEKPQLDITSDEISSDKWLVRISQEVVAPALKSSALSSAFSMVRFFFEHTCIRCPLLISLLVGAVWQAVVGFKSVCLGVIQLTNFKRKTHTYFYFLYHYYFETWSR